MTGNILSLPNGDVSLPVFGIWNAVGTKDGIERPQGACAEILSVSRNGRDWLDVYRDAVMEFDRDKLPASIDLAEKAIHQRLRGLPIADSKKHGELRDALNNLAVLKRML